MLWTIIVILAIIWVIAQVTAYTVGGLIHLVILVAIGLLVYKLFFEKPVTTTNNQGY